MNRGSCDAAPLGWQELWSAWDDPARRLRDLSAFEAGDRSFLPALLPERAVGLPAAETLQILERRLGPDLDIALSPEHTDPAAARPEAPAIRSPVSGHADAAWLRRANVVGINVRTVGSFWNVVKYCLTLPGVHDAVHLLPIWEPGVVDSLYGVCSWELNTEFFSGELAAARPHLDTVDRQLRAVVNLLHAGGRTVGMDVIPHTDRYSQMSLAHPEFFEWLRREDDRIVDHREALHEEVQDQIAAFLVDRGPALPGERSPTPATRAELFSPALDEALRLRLLFGCPADPAGREARRLALVKHLHGLGYEPVPATMGPPYRGIEVDPRPDAATTDEHGMVWRDYRITRPGEFSRVFGPLARYRLYGRKDNNADWEIDFSRPREAVWRYVCERHGEVQRRFGFDFMRGDMSHVQMRPDGVPDEIDDRYDLLRAVKRHVQAQLGQRHFGYFAESFLAPPGAMAYGDEVEHLEASEAEITLGDLQSVAVGEPRFVQELGRYLDLAATRRVAPCITVMTADKDDPRFDAYYVAGGELRLFLALFLPDMPSYVGLGFEIRDVHHVPAPAEHYTKLYVFRRREGPFATRGSYRWGRNADLFRGLTRLRIVADELGPTLRGRSTRWIVRPDPAGTPGLLCWTQAGRAGHLMLANTDPSRPVQPSLLSADVGIAPGARLRPVFSTGGDLGGAPREVAVGAAVIELHELTPGAGRIYRVEPAVDQPPRA